MPIKSIEQKRAKKAYDDAKDVRDNESNSVKDKYKSYAKGLANMIKVNGLSQTFAFISTKIAGNGDEATAYNKLAENISSWLSEADNTHSFINTNNNANAFIGIVVDLDRNQYKTATVETLAYLNWLRRFADGLISDNN